MLGIFPFSYSFTLQFGRFYEIITDRTVLGKELSRKMALFDSRNLAHRRPFGAVTEDTAVLFRICLPRSLGCRQAWLRVGCGGNDTLSDLFWAGETGDGNEWWECHFTPTEKALYHYDFRLRTDRGERYLCALPDGTATLSYSGGARWQLTCYDKNFCTPDWLAGGVMYQIFPDRFRRTGHGKPSLPEGRVWHESWDESPVFLPDETGEIRNNDFFGGTLCGIRRSLSYFKELGVTCLYLNPIFESASNHRYDTADYRNIDPLLGDEAAFRRLTKEAKKQGIRIVLDGVFSHTGADSRYFNRENRYPAEGAYNTEASPYRSWYNFRRWPNDYASWWGFLTLPELNKEDPAYQAFMFDEDGVVPYWLNAGASGWRLDVADELPDSFLDRLRRAAKAADPDALILGEVWEDASNKVSYNKQRRYLLGDQLDSVMNYPFEEAVLQFVRCGDGTAFFNAVMTIAEHYPPPVLRLLMNHIGTHDTMRALTALAGEPCDGKDRVWQSQTKLSPEQRALGLRRLRLASALQYCLPGVPCLYYGDEVGMEGYRDPFNRGTYPWGKEDKALLDWYRELGAVRHDCTALKEGSITPLFATDAVVCFVREDADGRLLCAVNQSNEEHAFSLPAPYRALRRVAGDGQIGGSVLQLPPLSCMIAVGDL